MFFPYIHLVLTAAPPQGSWGLLEPIPAVIRRQAGKHLGQVACPSQPVPHYYTFPHLMKGSQRSTMDANISICKMYLECNLSIF